MRNHLLLLSPLLIAISCGPAVNTGSAPRPEAAVPEVKPILEEVGGIAVVPLTSSAFSQLPLKQKLLAYHLYKAAVAGRDITWDQNHAQALALRRLLDGVLSVSSSIPEGVEQRLRTYLKMLWLNNGPYQERTKARIPVPFTREELARSVGLALAGGANLGVDADKVGPLLSDLDPLLFDPTYLPLVTNKNPGPDGDMLRDSAVNYYQGVTMADLAGFQEHYPLNSKLVRNCDKRGRCEMKELVYRAGQAEPLTRKWMVEPGLYASQLEAVIGHLEKAIAYADERQARSLELLIRFFRTGEAAAFDEASVSWLGQDVDVDLILGFIETYKDPRGQKGEFEGLVYVKDTVFSDMMRVLAEQATYFEQRLPFDPAYRNEAVRTPVADAVHALVGVGGAGPFMPAGVNLPNAQWIREKHGSRSILLTNVMDAANNATAGILVGEFALPELAADLLKYGPEVARAKVALHEVIGHGSGKVSATLQGDPAQHLLEVYSTLEEARADLVALFTLADPLMVEKGLISSARAAEVGYQEYLMGDLVQLRRVPSGSRFEDDHMRARHLIVQYLLAKGGAAEKVVQGKTYYVMTDFASAHKAVAELLREVMRIKAEGDRTAGKSLVEQYGIHFKPALRDQVVARSKLAGVPQFLAFHTPELHLALDDHGNVTDVVAELSEFGTTMLQWDLVGP